jgi:hypothetical protein
MMRSTPTSGSDSAALLQQTTGKIATFAGKPLFSVAFIATWPLYLANTLLLRCQETWLLGFWGDI